MEESNEVKLQTFKIPKEIWEDKRIRPEGKLIYTYIYSKGFNRVITDLNVGELQQVVKINNLGLKKNLDKLEKLKYIIYQEYDVGMYTINLLGC